MCKTHIAGIYVSERLFLENKECVICNLRPLDQKPEGCSTNDALVFALLFN